MNAEDILNKHLAELEARDSKKRTAGEGCAVAAGSAGWHLIDDLSVMEASDEALSDDCQNWWRLDSCRAGRWMIGKRYSQRVFVPIRRPGPRPDPLAHLTLPNK